MALAYDAGQWTIDGEPASDAEVAAYRDAMADQGADDLGQLARETLPDPLPEDGVGEELAAAFVLLLMRRVTEQVVTAYLVGRGRAGPVGQPSPTPPTGPARPPLAPPAVAPGGDAWRVVVNIVVRQQTYANGFGVALMDGGVSHAQAVARARMYSGAAVEAFELGKAHRVGFDAPAYPSQGCRGGARCRCYWSIVEFPDRFEATWRTVGDAATCDVCRQRARDWAPLVQPKGTR